jgi:hypothetical protein
MDSGVDDVLSRMSHLSAALLGELRGAGAFRTAVGERLADGHTPVVIAQYLRGRSLLGANSPVGVLIAHARGMPAPPKPRPPGPHDCEHQINGKVRAADNSLTCGVCDATLNDQVEAMAGVG